MTLGINTGCSDELVCVAVYPFPLISGHEEVLVPFTPTGTRFSALYQINGAIDDDEEEEEEEEDE